MAIEALPKRPVVLVAVTRQGQSTEETETYLHELAFLADTAGYEARRFFTQKVERPDTRHFVGKGKLEEIIAFAETEPIEAILFDDDLSPSQMRNLETMTGKAIYDRSLLILEIFMLRAQTAQARAQVELARNEYLLPRLTRMWTHLERQRGGTGTRGGSGEMEIETDRRVIKQKIVLLKERLIKMERQEQIRRKSRSGQVRVALVGYTNTGKSTLMNALSKAGVLSEDKLFATVDATVRRMNLNQIPFLLSDTVGFIRKLPHGLIESFKSTLMEVCEADILLHVVDFSSKNWEDQVYIVNQTLMEIGAGNKRTIMVFNKIDDWGDGEEEYALSVQKKRTLLSQSYVASQFPLTCFISASEKVGMDVLREMLATQCAEVYYTLYPNYLKNPSDIR